MNTLYIILKWLYSISNPSRYNWNIVESGVKHHKTQSSISNCVSMLVFIISNIKKKHDNLTKTISVRKKERLIPNTERLFYYETWQILS